MITGSGSTTAPRPSLRVWMARHAEYLSRPFTVALRLASVVAEAIPIGLLRREEIVALVQNSYAEAPDFYDPKRYRIRHEEALLPMLATHRGGQRLLDLYCGHGREAEIFARAGYHVLGVDDQQRSIDEARRYAEDAKFDAQFLSADVNHFAPSDQRWDIVYSSLWMYSTIPDRCHRLAWLAHLSQWLSEEGLLVLSTTPRKSRLDAQIRHAVARAIAFICMNSRSPELGDRFYTRLFWHDFTLEDVLSEVAEAGLDLIETLEIGGSTPCVFYILHRRSQQISAGASRCR